MEREKKKKEREEVQKQRAEQRAKKAEERAKLMEKKAEERRLRTNKRCAPKAIAPSTTKKTKVASKAPGDPATAGEPSTSLTSSETAASSSKPSRQRKADHEEGGDGFDKNQCCVCFRTYKEDVVEDTGLDWLQCACKRWLHEECIDYDIGHDADGNDLLCPFCCV